jgi:hypothetical protein
MSGRHILIKSLYGIGSGHLTILLVHIMGTRARIVADPNSKVLDLEWTFFMDLVVDTC